MECSEINILSCVEQYRERQDDYSCADKKVRSVAQSLSLHPASTHTSSLQNRVQLKLNSEIPALNLMDTDVLGAKVDFTVGFSKNLGDPKETSTLSSNLKVYDDKGNSARFNASQEFTKDGLGYLDISCNVDYDDKRAEPETRYED